MIALAVGYAQFAAITVLGDVAERFGRDAAVAAVTATGLGAGLGAIRLAALASPAIAARADRWGRRRVLMAATAQPSARWIEIIRTTVRGAVSGVLAAAGTAAGVGAASTQGASDACHDHHRT